MLHNQYIQLTPLKWYGPAGKIRTRYPYPSPQSMLRASVTDDITTYHWTSEGPTTLHIRAAAVFPRDTSMHTILQVIDKVQWGLVAFFESKTMVIVSELKARAWIDTAIEAGAEAWLINNNTASTWLWNETDVDENNVKVRPKCSKNGRNQEMVKEYRLKRPDKQRQIKKYDYQALVADCAAGLLTHGEIGVKYGLTRQTVIKIAHRNGLKFNVKKQT